MEAGSTSILRPYMATATTARTDSGWDVGLVVASEVSDLVLVEEHDAGDRGEAAAGEDADRLVGLHVVVEGEEGGELGLRPGDQFEGCLGGDAERALVAREELLEREAGGGLSELAAAALGDLDDLAGGEDDLHADHEVARVAVAGAEQRPAARCRCGRRRGCTDTRRGRRDR